MLEQYKGLRKEIYVLLVGRIVTNMGGMIWPMLTIILSTKLNMSASTIASVMLAVSIISMPTNLLGGRFADKYNKKHIIVICDSLSIIGYLICAFIPFTFNSVIILVFASILQSLEGPAYDALTADLTLTKDRDRTYSLSYLGNNLGVVLAPIISGFLIQEHLPLAFIITGVSIGISTILIGFFVKDISIAQDKNDINIYEEKLETTASTIKYIFSHRVILTYIIYAGIAIAVYCQYNYLMPIDLSAVYGSDGSILYGTMSSLNCIVVIVCTAFITSLIAKIYDTRKMIIADFLEISGLMIFAIFIRSVFMCYASIIIFTFGEIINTIVSTSYISKRIPASHRGRLLSVITVFNNLCIGLMQKVSGIIYDNSGSKSAWSFTCLVSIGAILLLTLISVWDRKDYKELYK